jgi:hypothetical protein
MPKRKMASSRLRVNSHRKVKFMVVVKAENIVAEMTPVITNVLRKGGETLSITDLNLLK